MDHQEAEQLEYDQESEERIEGEDGWVDARIEEFVSISMDQPEYGQNEIQIAGRSRNINPATNLGFGGSETMLSMQEMSEREMVKDDLP